MSKNNISITEIKRNLKTFKQEDLISIIADCYKLSDDVKKYFNVMFDSETSITKLYEEAKQAILHEFFPVRGFGKLRLSQAKKAITDFNKLCNDQVKSIDLMLYYVEMGVDFTLNYGDIHEAFYNSMVSMFVNVAKKITSEDGFGLYMLFKERLQSIVTNTSGIGWGFHDDLSEIYFELESQYDEVVSPQ